MPNSCINLLSDASLYSEFFALLISIPSFFLVSGICKFKNLVELNLRGNNFEGHLPPCVNNLTILRALDLSFNQLTGNIPSLNLLTSLEYLSLQDNNFEGLFSFGSLANLSQLEIFQLSTKSVLETENFL
ncbi:hypothetical protein Q3G72_002956 [Acer saccharum]|nr:hypothetical protein Q3G72_002956 [Acer saccharum]